MDSMQGLPAGLRVAVLVPCFNEEAAVGKVVRDFLGALPGATVYVYDNNSRDRTAEVAAGAGAVVRRQPLQGKGHVVRRMFADVEADAYVLVDGDATYDAASAPEMLRRLVRDNLDMVNGRRRETCEATYRHGHRWGNAAFTGLIARIFGDRVGDLLSGYRVLSRRFVKSFPVESDGFQIETEMTVHALALGLPVDEVDTPYYARPEGSESKLSTYRDGWRILRMVAALLVDLKPLQAFGTAAALAGAAAVGLSLPVLCGWLETGMVTRLPTVVLAGSLGVLSALLACAGIVLAGVARARREAKQMAYLALPGPARG